MPIGVGRRVVWYGSGSAFEVPRRWAVADARSPAGARKGGNTENTGGFGLRGIMGSMPGGLAKGGGIVPGGMAIGGGSVRRIEFELRWGDRERADRWERSLLGIVVGACVFGITGGG
jgi:hypothetical protein